MTARLSPFQLACGAALLLHLLLLAVPFAGRRPQVETTARIAIRLRPAAAPVQPVQPVQPVAPPRPQIESNIQSQSVPIAQPVAPAAVALPPPTAAAAVAVAAAHPEAPPATADPPPLEFTAVTPAAAEPAADRMDAYLALVRAQIERHKTYPAFARQLRQQGTVTVRVVIAPDGRLRSAAILVSSGFASLDRAALAAVRSTGRFAAPAEHTRAEVAVDIPLAYQLI